MTKNFATRLFLGAAIAAPTLVMGATAPSADNPPVCLNLVRTKPFYCKCVLYQTRLPTPTYRVALYTADDRSSQYISDEMPSLFECARKMVREFGDVCL